MRIVCLFNLKPGADAAVYEAWARGTDIPGVNALASVRNFTVHRATGVFGSDAGRPTTTSRSSTSTEWTGSSPT